MTLFAWPSHADEASARPAVEDREIYGAVALTATGPKCSPPAPVPQPA